MTVEDIRKLYWNEPFQPFFIILTDGRRVPVTKREYLSISPGGQRITIGMSGSNFEIVDLKSAVEAHLLNEKPVMA